MDLAKSGRPARWLAAAGLGVAAAALILPWASSETTVAGWQLGAERAGVGGSFTLGVLLAAIGVGVTALVFRRPWAFLVGAYFAAFAVLSSAVFATTITDVAGPRLPATLGTGVAVAVVGLGCAMTGLALASGRPGSGGEPLVARLASLGGVPLIVGGLLLPWVRHPVRHTMLESMVASPPASTAWLLTVLALPFVVVAAIRPARRGGFRLVAGCAAVGSIVLGTVYLLLSQRVAIVESGPDGTGGGVFVDVYIPGIGALFTAAGAAMVVLSGLLARGSVQPAAARAVGSIGAIAD
jgi:hypothetical protein